MLNEMISTIHNNNVDFKEIKGLLTHLEVAMGG